MSSIDILCTKIYNYSYSIMTDNYDAFNYKIAEYCIINVPQNIDINRFIERIWRRKILSKNILINRLVLEYFFDIYM